jgi:hypothetical protein
MNSLKRLSDKELTGRLRQLVSKEQSLTLSILPHLAEVERRGLHLEKRIARSRIIVFMNWVMENLQLGGEYEQPKSSKRFPGFLTI